MPKTKNPSNLHSTALEILEQNPRFRLLVLGKAGVGKSTLINKAFGLNDNSMTSHNKTGVCDINKEIIPRSNNRLVVHDSQGFDAGESDNLQLLKKFIAERTSTDNLSKRLHCIWLCIQTPFGRGRVAETGTEELLDIISKHKVPLVVIFTKYDRLVATKMADAVDLMPNEADTSVLNREARRLADEEVEGTVKPMISKHLAKINSEIIAVSVNDGYEQKLRDLVDQTVATIEQFNSTLQANRSQGSDATPSQAQQPDDEPDDPSILMGIAQRINPELKVKTIIKIGRKRYWRGMASSIHFPGISMKKCFHVLHTDIVEPWNFPDSEKSSLLGKNFEYKIINLVDDSAQPRPSRLGSKTSSAGAIAGVVGASVAAGVASGPAAVAVVPAVFGVLVLAKWVLDTYKEAPETLRRMMMYIIHLTNVLTIKFCRDGLVAPTTTTFRFSVGQHMEAAIKDYKKSQVLLEVRDQVDEFIKSGQWRPHDRDAALTKLEEVIMYGFQQLIAQYGASNQGNQ